MILEKKISFNDKKIIFKGIYIENHGMYLGRILSSFENNNNFNYWLEDLKTFNKENLETIFEEKVNLYINNPDDLKTLIEMMEYFQTHIFVNKKDFISNMYLQEFNTKHQ